jgi:hypothetical protein
VEPWLYEDSNLYKSQEQLVQELNNRGIKEKLDGFTVDNIEMNNDGSVYHIYVTENISISYPGKEFVPKQYKWVYSAVDPDYDRKYKLTYLEKWDQE